MMHTSYTCSSNSIISITTYSAFNNNTCCSFNPFERCPSNYCSFPVNSCKFLLPTNPSYLYGLRQSSLIQCPPSRRFVLGSSDRVFGRVSNYDVGRCCCVDVRQERIDRIISTKCKVKCCVSKEKSVDVDRIKSRMGTRPKRDFRSNAVGDVQAMLSLLSEGIVEDPVVAREKKRSSFKQGKGGIKQNVPIEKLKDRKPNVGFGYRGSEPKSRQPDLGRVSRIPTREEGLKREDESENPFKDEDRMSRRESSSSYYSLLDSEDFESEQSFGDELKEEQSFGESSSSHIKDLRKSQGVVKSEETEKNWEKSRDEREQVLQSSAQNDLRVSGSIQRDWRKKSEKKLTDESDATTSKNDSVAKNSQLTQDQEGSSMIGSKSKRQFNYQEEQSTSDLKSLGLSSSHIIKDNRANRYSKSSNQNEHSMQINRKDAEKNSSSWITSTHEDNSKSIRKTGCDYCETCGRSMEEEKKTQSGVQRLTDRSEAIDAKLTISGESLAESSRHRKHEKSSRLSESSRHRNHEKSSISLQKSSVDEESRQHDQIHMVTGESSAKRTSQHVRESVSTDDSCTQSTLRATEQSESGVRNLVDKSRTTAEGQSRSTRRKEEKSSNSLQTSLKEENKKYDEMYLRTGQSSDARRKPQYNSEVLVTDASYLQSTSKAQQQSDARKKQTTSLVAAEELRRLREDSGRERIKDTESHKVSHTDIGGSRVCSSNLEINSQSGSDKIVYNEQNSSKLKLKSVEELVEKHTWIDETTVQSRAEVQGSSTGHFSGETIRNQPSVPFNSLAEVEQLRGEKVKSGQLSVTSPPYQGANQFPEASSKPARKAMGRTTKADPDIRDKNSLASSSSSYGEVDNSGSNFGEKYFPEDALDSAARMQESSSLIIGEFVQNMSNEASASGTSIEQNLSNVNLKHQDNKYSLKESSQLESEDALDSAVYMQKSSSQIVSDFIEKSHEASTSETGIEKKPLKAVSMNQDKNYMLKGSTLSDSENVGLQKHDSEHLPGIFSTGLEEKRLHELDSKRSSGDSGTKESSDQMWDVKDHFIQEDSGSELLEGTTSGNVGSEKSGKSLWNAVSGALRLRWGSHSGKKKSPVKVQSLPSRSDSGEAYFSENEADEAKADGMRAEQTGVLQETTFSDQLLLGATRSQKEDVAVASLDEQSSHVDLGASSSSSVLHSSSLSFSDFVNDNASLKISQHMSQPSSPVYSSTPEKLRRSFAFEEDGGEENIEASTSSSDEQREISVDVKQTGDSASKGTEVEPKRKRLQRSKVVLQRYEDWEYAYKREREQRKVDEIFMREALSEAMKAGDSWEVPVGAVLVHNGNIIARGYNLVEELRDSTAHAEMICIKEASNVLQTWRLAETTLYVTLEPCPMCAGAILQARISTLVWGAPNKLLGADGSWIRLFNEGEEGEERAEVTDKPAAPAHPFHPNMEIRRGILKEECADIMQQFFQFRRRKAKEKAEISSEKPESVQPSCFPKPHHRPRLLHKMHNVFRPLSKQQSD